jgi:hypothetical protein
MTNDLNERLAALEDELATLKAHLSSRRDVFKKLAVAGAGVAVGSVALRAGRADATTGNALVLGDLQSAANITYVTNLGAVANSPGDPLTTEKTMFWIDNRNSTLPNGYGVRGDGHGVEGVGVHGNSDFGGIGVLGGGGTGVVASGTVAALRLVDTGVAPPTRSDAHVKGEVTTDGAGALWYCVADGTPGTWRRLAGASTAGALSLLAAPVRVYDSRPGGSNAGPIAGGTSRIVDLAGPVTTPAVPPGATGALISLTLDSTVSSGFLAVFANGLTWPGNSNTNWYTTGQILAVTTVTAVDAAAKIVVLAGGPGSTQFVIDVIGYYQ